MKFVLILMAVMYSMMEGMRMGIFMIVKAAKHIFQNEAEWGQAKSPREVSISLFGRTEYFERNEN